MSLLAFCEWLAATEGSIALHESMYMYPIVESSHVLALTLFVGFAVILDLRLLGLILKQVPVSQVADRLLPWTIGGFVVMNITGLLLFYAIPIRTYQSIFFRAKLIFLILAGLNVWLFHSRIYQRIADWDHAIITPDGGAPGRPRLADSVGRHHRVRAHDRLQLVRLRHPAAAGVRQLGGGLRGAAAGALRLPHHAAAVLSMV